MKLGIKYFLIAIILLAGLSCADNESITYGITGTWKWTYTCGGITGVCGYADESNTRTLEITQDKMIETWDDNSVSTTIYSSSSKTNYEGYTEYIVQFENGSTSRIKASKNALDIENGDTWTGYKNNF
jgi:hypothetical protein